MTIAEIVEFDQHSSLEPNFWLLYVAQIFHTSVVKFLPVFTEIVLLVLFAGV